MASKRAGPRLTEDEREVAAAVLKAVRGQLEETSGGDPRVLWAMRRYVYIRLQYDERGSPAQRKALKARKRAEQDGKCPLCRESLPERGAELDRFDAVLGYTDENTRLLCHNCHRITQADRGFA